MHPIAADRRGERGLAIVLTFIVVMLLVVVLSQVTTSSRVEFDGAASQFSTTRMAPLADACAQHAEAVLLLDLETTGDDSGGGSGSGGVDAFGDALGGSSGSPLGDDAAQITSKTDSQLDEWMNPSALQPSLGEGYTVYVEVIDEDSKVNLLGLWAADEDKRAAWRETFVRLLDKAFEGTSLDFSAMDADQIVRNLDDWVNGQRPADFPLPKLKPSQEEKDAQDNQLDTDIIENDERNFPLSLGELLCIEGIEPRHLTGFVEDDTFHPGLDRYLTLWSHLELQKPVEDDDDPFGGSVFADKGNKIGSQKDDQEDELLAANLELTADATNDGLVNANTAPFVVLRAIAPDDIPTTFLEQLVEFRDKVHETRDKLAAEAAGQSLFDQWNKPDQKDTTSNFSGGQDTGQGSGQGDSGPDERVDEEDDPARYVFETPDEVISKVEEEFDISLGFARDDDKKAFTDYLTTTSQVFTIRVLLKEDATGRRQTYRTIVWRSVTSDGPRIIVLEPLEPCADPRRDKDLPDDLQDINQDRFF
ncbi:MAG: general secretion pathway protein GspK [Planctomycetes bacterium]|nr:general secretion pathway protein GspK [Planctomycetota bacterium]